MAKIVGYIAASLDGFIAAENGNLDWLFKYDGGDMGEHDYRLFIKGIRTVVMGRDTYDFIAASDAPWAYGDQRCIVVTSRPVEGPKGPLETRHDIDALIAELRALEDGDVWMLGGGRLQMAFLERGALDEIEIYVIPELIGGGIPLFPAVGFKASPVLLSAKTLDRGCVRLHYAFQDR
ncbi:dihydrofolate reductase [Brucella anthropi]|uniref:dihydrofolate reductase family protein n=1 Tax=Brucella anthropi TaxID=529 RepID=UPI003987DE71